MRDPVFAQLPERLSSIVHIFNSSDAHTILAKDCPRLIKTMWMHICNVLQLMLSRIAFVNTLLAIRDAVWVPSDCELFYGLLDLL
jgi:hypothetical protein